MADSGWLKFLEMPARITGGVFAGCIVIYAANNYGWLELNAIGTWLKTLVAVVGIIAGCLFASSVIAALLDLFNSWNRVRKQKAKALAHLDRLSLDELKIVTKAIEQDSPSITWPFDSPPIAPLVGSGLLVQHGGRFPGDYWPFTFSDFAWSEIQERKDELKKKFREKAAKELAERRRRR